MNNGLLGFPGPYTRTGGDGFEVITSSQRRSWPDGARYLKCRLQAAGGGGGDDSNAGSAGGDTTITYCGTTYTVNGGSGGSWSGVAIVGGAGGSGGNCEFSKPGKKGGPDADGSYRGGDSMLGFGGATPANGAGGSGGTTGNGGGGGGGGEYGEIFLKRKPGCNWIDIEIGAGGNGPVAAIDGSSGLVILEWLPPLHTA